MNNLSNELVPDSAVQAALEYLGAEPHPVAVTRANVTRAENLRKKAFANEFLNAKGNNEERKATAEVSAVYEAAKTNEEKAIEEFRDHEQRVKRAELVIDLWRTVQSNNRAMERVR